MSNRRNKVYVEYENRLVLEYYDDITTVEGIDDSFNEQKDSYDAERLLYFLSTEEVEVLLLRHLGFKSNEIVEIMTLKDIGEYYELNNSMKIRTDLFYTLNKTNQISV